MSDICRWDERFIGYGYDKVSQITELHEAGYKFVGIPNVFITHWDHGVPKWRHKGDLVRQHISLVLSLTYIIRFEPECGSTTSVF
jgi:hypothetical protein